MKHSSFQLGMAKISTIDTQSKLLSFGPKKRGRFSILQKNNLLYYNKDINWDKKLDNWITLNLLNSYFTIPSTIYGETRLFTPATI